MQGVIFTGYMCVMLLALMFMHDMFLAAVDALQHPCQRFVQPLLVFVPRVARVAELHSAMAVEASSVNMRVALDGAHALQTRACQSFLVTRGHARR